MGNRRSTKLIVVHVTATPPNLDIGAREIDRMHKNRGWSGIGYHEVLRRNGRSEAGRNAGLVGAHVAGYNSISYGISMVGGVDSRGRAQHNATKEQMKQLEDRLRTLTTHNYPQAKVCGHRDLSPDRDKDGIIEPHEHLKACPCFDVIPWARERGIRTTKIKGVWDLRNKPLMKAPDRRALYLQKLLRMSGYEIGPVDGIIGPRTIDALKRFQNAAGLPVTGEFDRKTVKRLRAMHE